MLKRRCEWHAQASRQRRYKCYEALRCRGRTPAAGGNARFAAGGNRERDRRKRTGVVCVGTERKSNRSSSNDARGECETCSVRQRRRGQRYRTKKTRVEIGRNAWLCAEERQRSNRQFQTEVTRGKPHAENYGIRAVKRVKVKTRPVHA